MRNGSLCKLEIDDVHNLEAPIMPNLDGMLKL